MVGVAACSQGLRKPSETPNPVQWPRTLQCLTPRLRQNQNRKCSPLIGVPLTATRIGEPKGWVLAGFGGHGTSSFESDKNESELELRAGNKNAETKPDATRWK